MSHVLDQIHHMPKRKRKYISGIPTYEPVFNKESTAHARESVPTHGRKARAFNPRRGPTVRSVENVKSAKSWTLSQKRKERARLGRSGSRSSSVTTRQMTNEERAKMGLPPLTDREGSRGGTPGGPSAEETFGEF